ncbi:ParA family protein [Brachybacterium paraconglomeratum]|uniref:ParA family protein n=1 Tax=Brachybacterium paraconglomeratum TaxID=173362 RepID=UPI0022B06524|nr:ParA family protein [Brachybacterium paraconglomeratum]MCZ4326706.1 ParA family protein [Brachybacterium paraconglomeratum]
MIITLSSKKGGTGKTYAAVFLAQALSQYGSVQVLDADPQATATNWALIAEDEDWPLEFEVVPANVSTIKRLRKSQPTDHVLIDTPPGHPDIIKAANDVADVVIIPTGTSKTDLLQVWELVEQLEGKPHVVLLSKVNPRTRLYKAAVASLEAAAVPLFSTDIAERESIKAAYGTGLGGQPLHGYNEVLQELVGALGMTLTKKENA